MYTAFRLKPGRDSDLITWLEGFEPGDRSYYIRQAIRQGIQTPARQAPVEVSIKPKAAAEEIRPEPADLDSALDNWL
jgi:hypothetical protein